MADFVRTAGTYLAIANFGTQLIFLVLQLLTYRQRRHPSLLILSLASVVAVAYFTLGYFATLHPSSHGYSWRLYLAMELTFATQIVLSIWGASWLLRTFGKGVNEEATHDASPALPAPQEGQPATAPEQSSTAPKIRVIRGLFLLLTLRRVEDADRLATDRAIGWLCLVSIVIWACLDRLQAGKGATFYLNGVTDLSPVILVLLALALVLARRSRPALPYRQSLFILAALLPIAILLYQLTDSWFLAATTLLIVYSAVYLWRALRTFSGAAQPRAMTLFAVLFCGVIWLDSQIYLDPSLWQKNDTEDSADSTWKPQVSESLLFTQQARIDKVLSDVSGGDQTAPVVFFVGFAGVDSQKVFAEEIKLASKVVAQRFDTSHREVLLLNDRRDRDSYPLATVSGLRYALKGVARKMNLQRDILFLSLSSHGSSAPELSVSNGALNLDQVTGDNLAKALSESGIRWRVIVISACYAGAFIPALKDPNTIVITAAAADRTSFGCSNDRDLTYFGEAFYRDALPGAQSLKQAFSLAQISISKREDAEHITPSRPQAYFGDDITQVLSKRPMTSPGAP